MIDDDHLRAAVEHCAKMEAWHKLEKDPTRRQQAAQALAEARERMQGHVQRVAAERAERRENTRQRLKDGPVLVRQITYGRK